MANRSQLLIATSNKGKVAEFRGLLQGSRFELVSIIDFQDVPEVEETGTTFSENAGIKARGYAVYAGRLALADDSGLEVAALGGRPGIMSARYGGEGLGYTSKIRMLLAEMQSSGSLDRSARFVCSMAIASPEGTILHESSGICSGTIANEPRGENGFGYDPIFIPLGHELTFGEMDDSLKRQISHRALAIREIIPFLQHFNID